ncbi:MAG: anthranilate synthase component I family protein [Candidatus Dormibacteria bacterium]
MLAQLEILPGPEEVAAAAATHPLVALWTEIPAPELGPVEAFRALAGDGPGVILEELDLAGNPAGYSIVAGDPAALVLADGSGLRVEQLRPRLRLGEGAPAEASGGVQAALNDLAERLRSRAVPGLPTLTGGLAGLLCYEAAELLDGYSHPRGRGRARVAPISLLVLDRVVVFDHRRQVAVLVTHLPNNADRSLGEAALEEMAGQLQGAASTPMPEVPPPSRTLAAAPNISREMFHQGVRRIQDDISAGEIHQAVFSRRLSVPAREGGLQIYRRLRRLNPSPAMFFLRVPGLELAGSSPGPLVKVQGRQASTRPIFGTRRRGGSESEDQALEQELMHDPEKLAQHAMLLDLSREDLSRVCRPGTVTSTRQLGVQRFPRVMHMVSEVSGELAEEKTAFDALSALFPAATVTGAPKRRAMEIIAREEPTPRGPYAGACGYLSFAGDLEFCATIRAAVLSRGQVHVQAGAGIVSGSDPARELADTEAKASAILAAVGGA